MERIVLMGGPCSGQIHDLEVAAPEVAALDADGGRHCYMRTDAVDVADGIRVVAHRLAGPVEDPDA